MDKPNCYKCKYRGTVPGDAHSSCEHPTIKDLKDDPLIQLIGIMGSVGRVSSTALQPIALRLGIKGNQHGIKSGWFNWPVNFDPIWLENCDGWEQK